MNSYHEITGIDCGSEKGKVVIETNRGNYTVSRLSVVYPDGFSEVPLFDPDLKQVVCPTDSADWLFRHMVESLAKSKGVPSKVIDRCLNGDVPETTASSHQQASL